jgi:gamma-glutamylcyclotransferase (GGCT)/AIG2-like uncharacterized protein YtfP
MLETKYYFAYGANISKTSMKYRCPTATPFSRFEFRDWELDFFHHATIKRAPGKSVPGALWELTAEDEASLDAFEGFPHYYTKHTAKQDGKTFFFYVMNEGKNGYPSQGYVDDIREGYCQWSLPTQALEEAIKNVNERISTTRSGQFPTRTRNKQTVRGN